MAGVASGEDQTDGGNQQHYNQEYEEALEQQDEYNRALYTVHRVDRLTRKLQNRITRRTLAQVKSLREHGMDAVRYLLSLTYTVRLYKSVHSYVSQTFVSKYFQKSLSVTNNLYKSKYFHIYKKKNFKC